MADFAAKPTVAHAAAVIGDIASAPEVVEFQLTRAALALVRNNKEMQFRLTGRYPDGTYFTNRDD